MKKIVIILFIALSSLSIFNRVTELSAFSYSNESTFVGSDNNAILSLSDNYKLADIALHTVYEVPSQSRVLKNERGFNFSTRRELSSDRTPIINNINTQGISSLKYKLTGGDYLNISAPTHFFIYTLHKIRV